MENTNEEVKIFDARKILIVNGSILDGSQFNQFCMNKASMNDACAIGLKITDANLCDLEISNAQLGGAYIHNIGMPPKGHPAYDPDVKQRPLKFENCDLNGGIITDCNLSNMDITDCNLSGMKI